MSSALHPIPVPKSSQPARSSQLQQTASDSFFTCSPTRRFVFRTSLGKHSSQTLTITNNSPETLIYKVKTNEHQVYAVKFGCGYIEPHASVEVQVIQRALHRYPRAHEIARHRFLVVAAPLSAAPYRDFGEPVHASVLWLQMSDEVVRKRTLGVIAKQAAFYIPLEHLVTYNPSTLKFTPSYDSDGSCHAHVDVTNISDVSVLFKMKTTNHAGYAVRPRVGVIEPQQTSRIELSTQDSGKQGEANGDVTADDITAVSKASSNDSFKLEIAAIQNENVLLSFSPAELWPRTMPGDISTVILPVSKEIDDRSFDAPGTIERNFRNLRFSLKPRARNGGVEKCGFAEVLEDVLFWTPKILRVRAVTDEKQQPSVLHLSNISEHCLLYRFTTRNMGLYDIYPQSDIIAAYDSLSVSVGVQNLRVVCDDWVSLGDEASLEVATVDLRPEESVSKDESELRALWAAVRERDTLRVKVAVEIRNTMV